MLNAHVKFWDGPLFLNMEKKHVWDRMWVKIMKDLSATNTVGIWIWISNEEQQITSVAPDLWHLLC